MDLKQAAKQMQANKGVQKLLEGEDTRRMMELLGSRERVQQAAKAAMAAKVEMVAMAVCLSTTKGVISC